MTDILDGLDFGHALRDVKKGLIVKPLLHNYLYDAKFPAHTVEFPKEDMAREPDGWFHPSEHPLWPERALYHYLVSPHLLKPERLQPMNVLSIVMGKAVHSFIEMCLEDAGLRPPDLQACRMCPPEVGCSEPGVMDEETGSRGHMDGLLDCSDLGVPADLERPIFEFKTTNDMKLRRLDDLDLDGFREMWPVYYAQQQEYLRMSKRRASIVFVMAMGYPWEMREFHIPFNRSYAFGVRDKYQRVRQAAADHKQPRECCNAKSCGASRACGVSR